MSPPNSNYPDAPNGRDTLSEGQQYEEFVRNILNQYGVMIQNFRDRNQQFLVGENPQGVEIKLDSRCFSRDPELSSHYNLKKRPTWRLSIEVQEKTERSNWDWIDSGILRKDNTWLYVQGNYEIVFVFAKNWLLRFYQAKITPDDIHEYNGTVRKFYMPLTTALVSAVLVLDGSGRPYKKDEKGQWTMLRQESVL